MPKIKNENLDRLSRFYRFSSKTTTRPQALENEILIYGPIVDVAWFEDEVTTLSVLEQIEKLSGQESVKVRINSPGGIAWEGIAIYNALAELSKRVQVTTSIEGLAASAASLVAMAGDTITMNDNASLMIHDPWGLVIGSIDDLLKEAEVLDTIAQGMVNTYSKRTGLDKEEIRQMMKDETWFTAESAKEKGFVDEVVESKAKPESRFNLSIYSKVPSWVKSTYEENLSSEDTFDTTDTPEAEVVNLSDLDYKSRNLQLEELEI